MKIVEYNSKTWDKEVSSGENISTLPVGITKLLRIQNSEHFIQCFCVGAGWQPAFLKERNKISRYIRKK